MNRRQLVNAAIPAVPLAVVGFAIAGMLLAAGPQPSRWTPVVDPNAPASVTEVDGADLPDAARWGPGDFVYQFAPQVSYERLAGDGPPPTVAPPPRIPGELGIPQIVLDAYRKAATDVKTADPSCHLRWEMLAGIGQVETGHANNGLVYADGTTFRPILGPILDGSTGAAIPDTDDGVLDGNDVWDRAVGPMQFIPSTWRWVGVDGNGDGRADPHNAFDAALAAGQYLCTGSTDLADRAGLTSALLRYNHSADYVALVLAWIDGYIAGKVIPIPPLPPPPPAETTTMTTPPSSETPTGPPTTVPTTPVFTPPPTTPPPTTPPPTSPPPTSPPPTSSSPPGTGSTSTSTRIQR